jgi:hypothetical protein
MIKVVGVYLIGYVQLSKGVGQRGVVGGGVTSIARLSSCFLFKKYIDDDRNLGLLVQFLLRFREAWLMFFVTLPLYWARSPRGFYRARSLENFIKDKTGFETSLTRFLGDWLLSASISFGKSPFKPPTF